MARFLWAGSLDGIHVEAQAHTQVILDDARLRQALRGRGYSSARQLIDDLDLWNQFLNTRNLSVHDYVGMDDEEMIGLVQQFRDRLRPLLT